MTLRFLWYFKCYCPKANACLSGLDTTVAVTISQYEVVAESRYLMTILTRHGFTHRKDLHVLFSILCDYNQYIQ